MFFVVGAIAIGYGLTSVDFAFGDDRWGQYGAGVSDFPLIGTMSTESAFYLGMTVLLFGLIAIIIAARVAISNYSTVKNVWKIISGVLLMAWSIWGIAFAFNTVEWRITHGIDEVGIPCFDESADEVGPCVFTSEQWLLINFAMMGIGLIMVVVGTKHSRVVTAY